MKTINGGNYYYERAFKEACSALENGETIQIYIDCIGHTRNNSEQEVYKEAFIQKYDDLLVIEKNAGGYSYSYTYRLKHNVNGGVNEW